MNDGRKHFTGIKMKFKTENHGHKANIFQEYDSGKEIEVELMAGFVEIKLNGKKVASIYVKENDEPIRNW